MRGGINPGDIRVRSRVVGDVYVLSRLQCVCGWMEYDRGIRPCRLQMTVNFCTIRQKGHIRKYMFYFRLKLEPEIINRQIFWAVPSGTGN